MPENIRRVQFVISGWFLFFLILGAGCFAGAYWIYTHQPLPQTPPYYVNRTATAVRPCFQCVASNGKLKERLDWKLGKAIDIPAEERWWFAPVEEQPNPVKVDGIPMLAVHPAADKDKPWYGFDQHRVYLAVFQDLDARNNIEHPVPPSPPVSTSSPQPLPAGSGDPNGSPPSQPQ